MQSTSRKMSLSCVASRAARLRAATCAPRLARRASRQVLNRSHPSINPAVVRILKLVLVLLLVWHWEGCLWLYVSRLDLEVSAMAEK